MKPMRDLIDIIDDNEGNEYYTPPEIKKKVSRVDLKKLRKNQEAREKQETSGAEMFATDIKQDPHTIRLQSHLPTKRMEDPKFVYVSIIKYLQGENPYLPTVDEIELTSAKNISGKHIITYKMRKLFSVVQIPPSQVYFACGKVIKSILPQERMVQMKDPQFKYFLELKRDKEALDQQLIGNEESKELSSFILDYTNFTCDLLIDLCEGKRTTRDRYLKQFAKIIMDIRTKHPNFYLDIHANNVMFRIGSHGPQLVITDPLVL